MDTLKKNSQLILALALIYLATSLLLTAIEIKNIRRDVPVFLSQVETMETTIDIAGVIDTVNTIGDQVPSIVEEIKGARTTLDDINQQMPAILAETQALRKTTIPALIKESEAIRASAPGMLDKADQVATKLSKIPENMTSGVVKGTAKSVINAPGDLIKGVGEGVGIIKKKAPTETPAP